MSAFVEDCAGRHITPNHHASVPSASIVDGRPYCSLCDARAVPRITSAGEKTYVHLLVNNKTVITTCDRCPKLHTRKINMGHGRVEFVCDSHSPKGGEL